MITENEFSQLRRNDWVRVDRNLMPKWQDLPETPGASFRQVTKVGDEVRGGFVLVTNGLGTPQDGGLALGFMPVSYVAREAISEVRPWALNATEIVDLGTRYDGFAHYLLLDSDNTYVIHAGCRRFLSLAMARGHWLHHPLTARRSRNDLRNRTSLLFMERAEEVLRDRDRLPAPVRKTKRPLARKPARKAPRKHK